MTTLEQMGDSDGTGIDMHQFLEDSPAPTAVYLVGLVNYEGRFSLPAPDVSVRKVKGRFEDHYDP